MDMLGIGGLASSSGETKLKHLGFVKILVKAAMMVLCWLYQFLKEKFIYYVLTPLYNKAKTIFLKFLSYLDIKIDQKAPASVKSVLDRINGIVNMLVSIWSTIQLQIKLLGPENAMKVFGTFIKNYIVSTLLPMLAKHLFQIPGLSSVLDMSFPDLSKITSTIPGLDKLPKVPVPDLSSAFKGAAASAPRKLDANVAEDMTKAFDKVGVTPSNNFIGDLINPSSKPEKNGNNPLGLNIIGDSINNTLTGFGLAPNKDENGITEEK